MSKNGAKNSATSDSAGNAATAFLISGLISRLISNSSLIENFIIYGNIHSAHKIAFINDGCFNIGGVAQLG